MSNNDDTNFSLNMQRLVNANQSKLITAKIESQTILKDRLANQAVAGTEMRWQDAEQIKALNNGMQIIANQKKAVEAEVAYYKELLSKPMHEIANANENFKTTYKIQQEILAGWVVSQRAFKELAIDFGLKLGITKEEVIKKGFENKSKVLNNETEHGNNGEDAPLIKSYSDKLKGKLK